MVVRLTATAGLAVVVAQGSKEQFYGAVMMEGIVEYGSSFQVLESLHRSYKDNTFFARLSFDHDAWAEQNGCFGVQLIDGLFHVPYFMESPDAEVVRYAGGFKVSTDD